MNYLIVILAVAACIPFGLSDLGQSNETHFVATSEWQEIKAGKVFAMIVEISSSDVKYFRSESPTRTSLQDESSNRI
jgi:hypothetical protein